MAAEIPDGAVLVARAVLNSSLWTMRNEDRILAMTLIALANWKDRRWFDGQQSITIKRGQLVRSLKDLSEASRLSVKNVRTSLRRLEKASFLTLNRAQKRARPYTLITLPKYDFYQRLENYSDSVGTGAGTQAAQTRHDPGTTPAQTRHDPGNKQEGKEGKEGKEGEETKTPSAPGSEFDKGIEKAQIHPDYGEFPIRMAKLWNKHGFGHRINESSGTHQVVMALENKAKKKDIEKLIYSRDRCRGKKIWEALESVTPNNGNGVSAAQRFLQRTGGNNEPRRIRQRH